MEEKETRTTKLGTTAQRLLLKLKPGEVITSTRLRSLDISERTTTYLKQKSVLSSLGIGAYVRGNDEPNFASACQALATDLKLPVHIGGRSALEMQGVSQYLSLGAGQPVWIFSSSKLKLPLWFIKSHWKVQPNLIQTQFLDPEINDTILLLEIDRFLVPVSARERALLEAIFLIGKYHRFEEIDEIFENLATLKPGLLQALLEKCNSIRVCRIFLYLARKHNHPWLNKIDESKINLGNGKRVVVKGGQLDQRYQITVPRGNPESDA